MGKEGKKVLKTVGIIAVAAVAGPVVGAFLGVSSAVASIGISAILSTALASKPKSLQSVEQEARDRKQAVRIAAAPRRIVYGTARVSGSLVYVGTTGSDKGELWLVVPFHHGECAAVIETYLNDLLLSDARYSGVAVESVHLGTSGQTADSGLLAASGDWTADHRLRAVGYNVLHLTFNASAYPNGIPNPSFIVKGRKVYDPRTETTYHSSNAALCVLDYLIGTVTTAAGTESIGIGAALSEIDIDSFIAAANVCDEYVTTSDSATAFTVDTTTEKCTLATKKFYFGDRVQVSSDTTLPEPLAAATNYYVIPSTSGTVKLATSLANAYAGTAIDITTAGTGVHTMTRKAQLRYTCDGTVTLDTSPATIMEKLLTACMGTLVYSSGEYRLFVAAATASSFNITAGMLRGPVRYRPRSSRREIFNTARGTFIDPDNFYEAADFPAQSVAAYVTEDGGEEVTQDIDLPYTQDGIRAQRLARQMLKVQRLGLATVELQCDWSALNIAVWDTGTLDLSEWLGAGAPAKWRISSWRIAEEGGIDLTLHSEDDTAYSWSTSDEQTIAQSVKPSMIRMDEVPDITGLSVNSASYVSDQGAIIGALSIDWDDSDSAYVVAYDIQVRENSTSPWTISASSTVSTAIVYGLVVGTSYDVRVRGKRGNGANGAWTEDLNTLVSGDTTAPGIPSSVVATAQTGSIKIDWVNPVDSDFQKCKLYRHTSNDSGAASQIDEIFGLPGQSSTYTDTIATGQTRYYWLKAVDTSSNLSAFSSGVSATAL